MFNLEGWLAPSRRVSYGPLRDNEVSWDVDPDAQRITFTGYVQKMSSNAEGATKQSYHNITLELKLPLERCGGYHRM